MLTTQQLYDLNHSLAGTYLAGFEHPWQALKGIKDLILSLGPNLGEDYTLRVPGFPLHHRCRYGNPALCLYPRQRSGGRKLRGRQFRGTEERDPL